MKFWFKKYSLTLRNIKDGVHQSNSGVLLRFKDGKYSLYHPIDSLGDVSVDEFLKEDFLESNLMRRVFDLRCSLDDFIELYDKKVKAYYSVPHLDFFKENHEAIGEMGFKIVKLKCKRIKEINDNLDFFDKSGFKFIFDFNGKEKKESFENLSSDFNSFFKSRVLYVEDPSLEKPDNKNIKFASDFIGYNACDFHILKPTGFNYKLDFKNPEKSVVTSYLDHPLGQLICAKWALDHGVKNECGVHSHTYYEENEYSNLFSKTADFKFDFAASFFKLLENEDWTALN